MFWDFNVIQKFIQNKTGLHSEYILRVLKYYIPLYHIKYNMHEL